MFAFYLKVIGLNLSITNFGLLMFTFSGAGPVQTRDFLFANSILFLLITFIFISLDLLAPHSDRTLTNANNALPHALSGRGFLNRNLGRDKSSAQMAAKE